MNSAFETFRKLAPVPLGALAIALAFLLFAPSKLLAQLALDHLSSGYRSILGIVFVLSSAYLFAHLISWVRKVLVSKLETRKTHRQLESSLKALSPSEKRILAPYILNDVTSQHFYIQNGVVGGLVAKGILYRASNFGSYSGSFPWNIQPWALKYLKSHPRLLQVAGVVPDEQQELHA